MGSHFFYWGWARNGRASLLGQESILGHIGGPLECTKVLQEFGIGWDLLNRIQYWNVDPNLFKDF